MAFATETRARPRSCAGAAAAASVAACNRHRKPSVGQRGEIEAAAEELRIASRSGCVRGGGERNLPGWAELKNKARRGDMQGEPIRHRLDGDPLP
jgi:hypothetical protein